MLRVHRSRGAASGVLLILLGTWGGLIPFVGPYAHVAYTPDSAWTWTQARGWLEVAPGAITAISGLVVVLTQMRPLALLAALLAALSGAWFAVGGALAPLWPATSSAETPVGGPVARALEQIGFFSGVGVVIVATASIAMGRLAMISTKDVRAEAARAAAKAEASAPASTSVPRASGAVTPGKAGPSVTGMGPPSTGDVGAADTVTLATPPGSSDRRGWRLAGRTSTPRGEPDDTAS
jgi:hypothetical protein